MVVTRSLITFLAPLTRLMTLIAYWLSCLRADLILIMLIAIVHMVALKSV